MARRTTRSTILEVLAENPQGLAASGVIELVSRKYATVHNHIPVVLCILVKAGKVRKYRGRCECCFKENTFYKLGAINE